jgi:lysozyme
MTPEQAIKELVRVELNDNQTHALISFINDRGVSAFKNSNLLKVINRGEFDQVPKELNRWVINSGQKYQNLVELRQQEVELFTKTR